MTRRTAGDAQVEVVVRRIDVEGLSNKGRVVSVGRDRGGMSSRQKVLPYSTAAGRDDQGEAAQQRGESPG